MIDYTTVVGVDAEHLKQLELTWQSWKHNKPSLLLYPMIIFRDHQQVTVDQIRDIIDHPILEIYSWPMADTHYSGIIGHKWEDPQRYKMLSGYVHIPANFVRTPYWLKLDTDTVAGKVDCCSRCGLYPHLSPDCPVCHGNPTNHWIDEKWFEEMPAIVAHPWGFTKPADQMVRLDEWVDSCENVESMEPLFEQPNLNLKPKPGWSRVRHKRIISWCGFFEMAFTKQCARFANTTIGPYQMPVRSQDGYMWYCAKRMGRTIVRANMKSKGWSHWKNMSNIQKHVQESLSA